MFQLSNANEYRPDEDALYFCDEDYTPQPKPKITHCKKCTHKLNSYNHTGYCTNGDCGPGIRYRENTPRTVQGPPCKICGSTIKYAGNRHCQPCGVQASARYAQRKREAREKIRAEREAKRRG